MSVRAYRLPFLALIFAVAPALEAQVTTIRRPSAPVVNAAVLEEDKADSLAVMPPLSLSAPAVAARLTELGLRPNSIMEGETVKLTVAAPRHVAGNLGLNDVLTTSALTGDGWAGVRGSVITRFNAEAGHRYLVDFSVGDLAGASTAGTRRFTARIYSGAGAVQVQEFTVPKGAQHVVMIVEAAGTRPTVVLKLNNQAATAGAMLNQIGGGLTSASGSTAPHFIFYSAEISRLK